jgi:hypothetical protein
MNHDDAPVYLAAEGWSCNEMLHNITRKLGTQLIPIFCRIVLLNPFMLYRGIPRHLPLAIRNDEVTSNGLPLLELPLLNKVFELPLSIA